MRSVVRTGTAVVTWSSRGIGLELVRQLAESGMTVIIGVRDVAKAEAGMLWAVDLPPDGPTGGFFRRGEPVPW